MDTPFIPIWVEGWEDYYDGHDFADGINCIHPEHRDHYTKRCWKAEVKFKIMGLTKPKSVKRQHSRLVMNDKMEYLRLTRDNLKYVADRTGFSVEKLLSDLIRAEGYGGRAYVRIGLPWK